VLSEINQMMYQTIYTKIGDQTPVLSYDLNIHAMLTSFYLGTAGLDVGKFAELFGFP